MGILQNVIGGAMEGGGGAYLHSQQSAQEASQKQDLVKMSAQVELQKEQAIASYKNDLVNAPTNRAGGLIATAMQQVVPVTASPVTQLSGNDPTSPYHSDALPDSNTGKGLDPAQTPDLIKRIQALPDDNPDKADMLKQLQRQQGSDQAAANAEVAGKTRAPTSDEANEAAKKAALAGGDLQALAALKASGQDKYMKFGEGDTIWDSTTGKVLFSNTGKADRQAAHDDAVRDRDADRNDSRERMSADRLEAMFTRLGKSGQGTSLTQNVDMLKAMKNADGTPAYSDTDIRNFIFNKKETSIDDLAGKILTSDPNAGSKRAITPQEAVQKALALRAEISKNSVDATNTAPKSSTSSPAGLPAGAVQIGTSGGKPVYQTPDGKKFVQQ